MILETEKPVSKPIEQSKHDLNRVVVGMTGRQRMQKILKLEHSHF